MIHGGMSSSVSPEPRDTRRTRVAWAFVALLVLLVAWWRETGLSFQLPTTVLTDERVYLEQIEAFESGVENPATLPRAGFYPHLPARLAWATWRATHSSPASAPVVSDAHDVAAHLERSAELHVHVRRTVAWLSLLAIPAAYVLARSSNPRRRGQPSPSSSSSLFASTSAPASRGSRAENPFGTRRVALVTSALIATSILGEIYGQEGRPHAAFLAPLMLAVAAAIELRRRPTFPLALACGLAVGFGVSILQTGFFLLGPVVAALALAERVSLRRRLELFLTALLPVVAAFVWAYPFLFVEVVDPESHVGHGLLGEGSVGWNLITGSGFLVMLDALWSYEPLSFAAVLVAAFLGVRAWTRRGTRAVFALLSRPRDWSDAQSSTAVVCAFLVPYVVLFGLYERTFPRYALPLLPFTAWGVARVLAGRAEDDAEPSRTRAGRRLVSSTWPAIAAVVFQGLLVAQLARVRAAPDTLAQAAEWIERELPRDARVGVLRNDDLPLLRRPEQRAQLVGAVFAPHQPWLAYQSRLGRGPWDEHARDVEAIRAARGDDTSSRLFETGIRYVVLRSFGNPWRTDIERVYARITRDATLRATFRPIDDDDERPFVPRDQPDAFPREAFWIGRLWRAERVGPVVRIWELRGDG